MRDSIVIIYVLFLVACIVWSISLFIFLDGRQYYVDILFLVIGIDITLSFMVVDQYEMWEKRLVFKEKPYLRATLRILGILLVLLSSLLLSLVLVSCLL